MTKSESTWWIYWKEWNNYEKQLKGLNQIISKEWYDQKATENKLEVGDLVLIRSHDTFKNFSKELEGPYSVTR